MNLQKGTKAPQAAGRIHTDFEKGFIMAEVMHYKDFKEEGSEAACKSAGKYRQQGTDIIKPYEAFINFFTTSTFTYTQNWAVVDSYRSHVMKTFNRGTIIRQYHCFFFLQWYHYNRSISLSGNVTPNSVQF